MRTRPAPLPISTRAFQNPALARLLGVVLALPAATACGPTVFEPMIDDDDGAPSTADDDRAPAAVLVTPDECDFGDVVRGARGTCTITVLNEGERLLTLGAPRLVDGTPPLAIDDDVVTASGFALSSSAEPTVLAPGEGRAVVVEGGFVVDEDPRPLLGRLAFETGDPERPLVLVQLFLVGVCAPASGPPRMRVVAVDDVPVDVVADDDGVLALVVEPPALVILGTEPPLGSPGAYTSHQWSFLEKPPGSIGSFTNPNGSTTGIAVDLVGTWRIQVTTMGDPTGDWCAPQTDTVRGAFTTSPVARVYVQLSWDSWNADLDLILAHDDDTLCAATACWAATCADASSPPDWDDDGVPSSGDPVMTRADPAGYGPELIRVVEPLDGIYRVGVAAPDDTFAATSFTLVVYVDGVLAYERFVADSVPGTIFHAFDATLADGAFVVDVADRQLAPVTCAAISE